MFCRSSSAVEQRFRKTLIEKLLHRLTFTHIDLNFFQIGRNPPELIQILLRSIEKSMRVDSNERQRFLGEFSPHFRPFFRGFLQFPVDFPVISRLVYR
jgi:hypothetical protein